MSGACSTYKRDRCLLYYGGEREGEKRNMEDLSINVMTIQNWLAVVNAVMIPRIPYSPGNFLTILASVL